jgi:membrane-bound metal-dependent hydrolase YbcI (DUF457 family)
MKGIAHFVTGVAIATMFPEVVEQAAGGSLLPVLGGIAGILPDTLDFRFTRYFEKYDLEIDPGPEPDARTIAEQIAGAMRAAYETRRPQNVKLHTIRLGADRWRQYAVRFDPQRGQVVVRVGPLVTTGQVPLPGSDPSQPFASPQSPPMGGMKKIMKGGTERGKAQVDVGVPMVHTYDEETKVDIFSGPSFKFERRGDKLAVHFLNWHRRWSHSLFLAAALGLLGWLLFGKWGGLVVGLGYAAHILEDQLGYLGSNLLYPLTKGRTAGLRLLRSGDGIPNFLTVCVSIALILLNLDRCSAQPVLSPWWPFVSLVLVGPVLVFGSLYQWQRRREGPASRESLQQQDILSEVEETEVK